jgi:hypothetical protein
MPDFAIGRPTKFSLGYPVAFGRATRSVRSTLMSVPRSLVTRAAVAAVWMSPTAFVSRITVS